MKELCNIIGNNLNDIRKKRGLSLDKVAELTGVSKAMLGQIERGESNPTVTTLWKIATGLKVSFSSFMEESAPELLFVSSEDISPIIEEGGKMKVYPLFPFDEKRCFEVFTINLEPGCTHESDPHNEGVEEYIIVTEGRMEIILGEDEYRLKAGEAIRYYANRKHIYRNSSESSVCFQHLIYYFT